MNNLWHKIAVFAIVILSYSNNHAQVPTSGLMGWWAFDKNAIDSANQLNNGTVYGATLTEDRFGKDSSAYQFDGINDYIDCGKHSSLRSSSNTINFWFKYLDTSSNMVMVGNFNSLNGEWGLNCIHAASIGLAVGAGAGSNNHAMSHHSRKRWADNRWHMYTSIYDSKTNTLALYIDGCLSGYKNAVGSSGGFNSSDSIQYYPNEHWIMGAASQYFSSSPHNGPQWYKGSLDDIRIYNRALSMVEIHALLRENTLVDTNKINVYDTTYVTIYDTLFTQIEDTVLVYDTVYTSVTDTLFIVKTWGDEGKTYQPIKIYPNPSNGKFLIDYGNDLLYVGQKIKIYNAIGQLIEELKITSRITEINLSTFVAAGTYVLEIIDHNDKPIIAKKIVIY